MIARWLKIKNIEAFFKLHKILNEHRWKHSAVLVSEESNINAMPKTIKYLSPMKYVDLCDFYQSQGLIISPSHFETFGNVPMEAICLGTPAMVSDKMGCAEVLISAGLSDMVADFSDMDCIADRAKGLCGQIIPREKLERVRELLCPEKLNKQIYEILRKIVYR